MVQDLGLLLIDDDRLNGQSTLLPRMRCELLDRSLTVKRFVLHRNQIRWCLQQRRFLAVLLASD